MMSKKKKKKKKHNPSGPGIRLPKNPTWQDKQNEIDRMYDDIAKIRAEGDKVAAERK